MIRDAVLHINNEQPLKADLFELPGAPDVGLRCTNLRLMNGKRPIFADAIDSVFFFPMLHIRFIEIPPAAAAAAGIDLPMPVVAALPALPPGPIAEDDGELEIDEDFLRRIREA